MKAFPTNIDISTGGDGFRTSYGMELRDYFAAKAMPVIAQDWYRDNLPLGDDDNAYSIAVVAYIMADAMMKAREK
jgi:hypothetical protein